jgi:hypothetical protein
MVGEYGSSFGIEIIATHEAILTHGLDDENSMKHALDMLDMLASGVKNKTPLPCFPARQFMSKNTVALV